MEGDREFPELHITSWQSTVHDPLNSTSLFTLSYQKCTVYPHSPDTSTYMQHCSWGKACAGNSSVTHHACPMPWPQTPIHPASCFSHLLMRGGILLVFPQGASGRKVGISPGKLGAELARLYPWKTQLDTVTKKG